MCSGMKGLALVRDRTGLDRNRAVPKRGISSTLLFCLVESARCGLRASMGRAKGFDVQAEFVGQLLRCGTGVICVQDGIVLSAGGVS